MNEMYFIMEKQIPHDACDNFIDFFNKKESESGKHGDGMNDIDIRNSEVVGMPYGTELNNFTEKLFDCLITQSNAECFGFHLNGFNEFQISKYEVDDHYEWHTDLRLNDRSSMRKLSMTIQLSDPNDYEGGEFEFAEGSPDQSFIQDKGTIILFPSFLSHRITPVTRGTRYSLVGWYEGDKWK